MAEQLDIAKLAGRLRAALTDVSQTAIAERTGVSQRTVSAYLRGETRPAIDWLVLVCDLYGLSLDAIVRGQAAAPPPPRPGGALREAVRLGQAGHLAIAHAVEPAGDLAVGQERATRVIDRETYEHLAPAERGLYVPIVGVVQCGEATEHHAEHPVGWADAFAELTRRPVDRNAFAVRLRGESMEPNYRDDDLVLVGPNLQPVPNEPAVIVLHSGEATFKLWAQDRRRGTLVLRAYNPAYPEREIDAAAVRRVLPMIEHMPLLLGGQTRGGA